MKKLMLLVSLFLVQSTWLLAQAPLSSLKKDFDYTFISSEGTNASAVVWHPSQKMYLTLIAGNSSFPLEGFDGNGKSRFSVEIGADSRGMWYNSATKSIEINGAGELGWATVKFSKDLANHEIKIIKEGQLQPDFQSVGNYDAAKKSLIFINPESGDLVFYNRKTPSKTSNLKLAFGDEDIYDYNITTAGYTGKKGYEFVLLNHVKRTLVFFDRSGKRTATIALPDEVVVSDLFRFSFANDRAFFYDVDTRTWSAYKVF